VRYLLNFIEFASIVVFGGTDIDSVNIAEASTDAAVLTFNRWFFTSSSFLWRQGGITSVRELPVAIASFGKQTPI